MRVFAKSSTFIALEASNLVARSATSPVQFYLTRTTLYTCGISARLHHVQYAINYLHLVRSIVQAHGKFLSHSAWWGFVFDFSLAHLIPARVLSLAWLSAAVLISGTDGPVFAVPENMFGPILCELARSIPNIGNVLASQKRVAQLYHIFYWMYSAITGQLSSGLLGQKGVLRMSKLVRPRRLDQTTCKKFASVFMRDWRRNGGKQSPRRIG